METATITDDQLDELARTGDLRTRVLVMAARRVCYTAKQHAERDKARARCAAIIEARAGKEGR